MTRHRMSEADWLAVARVFHAIHQRRAAAGAAASPPWMSARPRCASWRCRTPAPAAGPPPGTVTTMADRPPGHGHGSGPVATPGRPLKARSSPPPQQGSTAASVPAGAVRRLLVLSAERDLWLDRVYASWRDGYRAGRGDGYDRGYADGAAARKHAQHRSPTRWT